MRTRPLLNSIFGSGVGDDPGSPARAYHPFVILFLKRGLRDASSRPLLLRWFVLLLCALWLLSLPVAGEPGPPAPHVPFTPAFCEQGCAIADLDGDGRPDLAIASAEGWGPSGFQYRIDLDLTTRAAPSSFSVFAQRGGLRIIPQDVNGDWELDLIITSAWSFTPVGVWINDGHGGFVPIGPAPNPQLTWGEGPGILSEPVCETFQATVPKGSRSWADSSEVPFFCLELAIKRLTFSFPFFTPPSGLPRRSQTRGPPLG